MQGFWFYDKDSCWHQSAPACSSKQLWQGHKNTNKYFSNYIFLCYTLRQFLQKVILWLCLFKANYVLVLGSRQEKELIKAENGGPDQWSLHHGSVSADRMALQVTRERRDGAGVY